MGRGDVPRVHYGVQTDYRSIFASNPDIAMNKEVSLIPGLGVLKPGTALAKITGDGPSKGKFTAYNPTTISSASDQPGRAFLVQDAAAGTDLFVTMDDSYKFQVGDQVYIADNDTKTSSAVDCGVITAIDRLTYKHMAKITVTNAVAGTTFTVAQSACIFHKAGADNSNTWSDCVGILELGVDTGVGSKAAGGLGTIIKKNAQLYNGMLTNVDSAAQTDLSASLDGNILTI